MIVVISAQEDASGQPGALSAIVDLAGRIKSVKGDSSQVMVSIIGPQACVDDEPTDCACASSPPSSERMGCISASGARRSRGRSNASPRASASACGPSASPTFAPIVLLPRRAVGLTDGVSPGLADVGLLLPYTPVHHLLFARLGPVPLVMTSANQGGSPIVFRDSDIDWLDGLIDGVLTHDRPIHVACEDSVVAVTADGTCVPVRRSRGYAPLPVTVTGAAPPAPVLATGGDLKTTFCLMGSDGRAHMSSHLGDMADPRTQACFDAALEHMAFITGRRPEVIACDLHPSYATTGWAHRQHLDVVAVQHHHAHAVSLMAEHDRLDAPMVAVAYDGTGYGTDGTIWGGELLVITEPARFTRAGHIAPFALPGGDGAVRNPARIALDLLRRAGVEWADDLAPVGAVGDAGLHILAQQLSRDVGLVPTSSMGRLFDAVASLLGVCQQVTYEGQAAVELEHLARRGDPAPLAFGVDGALLDPVPLIAGLVAGLRAGVERRRSGRRIPRRRHRCHRGRGGFGRAGGRYPGDRAHRRRVREPDTAERITYSVVRQRF